MVAKQVKKTIVKKAPSKTKPKMEELKKGQITHVMIHGAFTPEVMDVQPAHILRWHTGPKRIGDGKIRYMGKTYDSVKDLPDEEVGGRPIRGFYGNGWSKAGYSDLITRDGKLHNIIPYNKDDHMDSWEISNGAGKWNGHTRHICLAGGLSNDGKHVWEDNYTAAQMQTLEAYATTALNYLPTAKFIGHNQVSMKDCPGFSVIKWARSIGISIGNVELKGRKEFGVA